MRKWIDSNTVLVEKTMSLSIRHTGMYVNNINIMRTFYMKVFDLCEIYHEIESGVVTDAMFAKKNVCIEVCKLCFADGCVVELIYNKEFAGLKKSSRHICDSGQLHIAYTVNSADNIYNKIISCGGKCISKPNKSADGRVYVFFAEDPEGNYMEIVEEIV